VLGPRESEDAAGAILGDNTWEDQRRLGKKKSFEPRLKGEAEFGHGGKCSEGDSRTSPTVIFLLLGFLRAGPGSLPQLN
jgi:hypothetical protein